MWYCIDLKRKHVNNAWSKAPEDICKICKQRGIKNFYMPVYPKERSAIYRRLWVVINSLYYWSKLYKILKPGDVIIYQHPMYGGPIVLYFIKRIKKKKRCKFVALIHDLDSLRKRDERSGKGRYDFRDNKILKEFDIIIAHNERMKRYLISKGFDAEKIVCIDIFDYLSNNTITIREKGKIPSIAIAGNIGKSPYIYKIHDEENGHNPNLIINLFGNGVNESKIKGNMIYCGSFSPEALPEHLKGDFGLVWDGDAPETCNGSIGEYLRYNNPHKTSCYLAAGLPVIVWSQAAIAEFIQREGVGITIDSLYDIEKRINEISSEQYIEMCKNVKTIAEKLKRGFYFNKALDATKEIICNKNRAK